ncbi:MAG: hydrogenase expression/formation protein HypE [Lachnospiraceae bacterium]|nr:hydrogenase expression/formation protein HypE [Lachnospiraceae bacterium]
MDEYISLDYGSGGRKTAALIQELILPRFGNPALNSLGDGAVLPGAEQLVFSTDSFVVSPLFFPGGNIGKLAVCGTLNDVAMAGGEPKYLSFSLVIGEGFPTKDLVRILDTAAEEAKKAGVSVVTGDTKVVEKGSCDGLFINTAGIGVLKRPGLASKAIRPGDAVLVSGPLGNHGLTILLARHPQMLEAELMSDCANLAPMAAALYSLGEDLRVLRDPTRGGLATVCAELAESAGLGIELEEKALPIDPAVRTACDLLGLDPLYSANEGKLIAIVSADKAEEALSLLRRFPEGKMAAVIGEITNDHPSYTVLKTPWGSGRLLTALAGAQFPRIC